MVVLDSDHSRDHVLNELKAYSPLVTKGNYLIVEDTNLNGHPVHPSIGPGPMEAVTDFLRYNDEYQIDKERERFYITFNPNGYLKKIK
jgi:cephalosporin hydroxylase